jgi:hypothetical protein
MTEANRHSDSLVCFDLPTPIGEHAQVFHNSKQRLMSQCRHINGLATHE